MPSKRQIKIAQETPKSKRNKWANAVVDFWGELSNTVRDDNDAPVKRNTPKAKTTPKKQVTHTGKLKVNSKTVYAKKSVGANAKKK